MGYLALLDDTASTCRCHGGLQLLMLPHKLLTVAPLLRTYDACGINRPF